MPRSKVRPNVSTYHEAVNLVLFAINPDLQLPLTKKEDKYAAKSLCYLAGMLGLDINAKIQKIYATLQNTYAIPVEFLTWVRAMQQYNLGVTVPTSYGTFEENVAKVVMFQNSLKDTGIPDHYLAEEDFLEDEEFYVENTRLLESAREEVADPMTTDDLTLIEDTEAGEMVPVKPKQDWNTLAAKNPLAAAFVKSLMSTPDLEDDDEGYYEDHQYQHPDGEADEEEEYSMNYDYHEEEEEE
jgi:hypothetical protein